MKRTNIGGQAVIEGVMMRGKKMYAMAVRNPEGGITIEKKEWGGLGRKGLFRLPIFRGVAAFVDSLVTGTRILMRSAEIAGEDWTEEAEPSKFEKFLQEKLGDRMNDIITSSKPWCLPGHWVLLKGLFVLPFSCCICSASPV